MKHSILALLLLSGCTFAQPPQPTGNVSVDMAALATFTVADLQAAEDDAIATKDELSMPCYPALIKFVQSFPSANQNVAGAFTAFQKARDIRHGVEAGLPNYLKLGCAALVADEKQLIAKLAFIGGAGAATSGASIFVPFVPVQ